MKIFLTRTIAMACLLFAVSACQTSGSDVGEGYINLSPGIEASFKKYQTNGDPFFFAVSINGRSAGWVNCPSFKRCENSTSRSQALQYCKINSGGVPCKIYAQGKYVVWKNPNGPKRLEPPVAPAKETTTLVDLSMGTLCGIATKVEGKWAAWDNSLSDHVIEAKRRGLSLQRCATLTGKEFRGSSGTAKNRLRELKELLDDGTITQSDYEDKKREILSSI
jgi:hypothetical protein